MSRTKPCPKCGVLQEVIAVDGAGHEMTGPCETCKVNARERHITGATVVEGHQKETEETADRLEGNE